MKKILKKNKSKIINMLFCFIISIITLTVCSKNSPLYPFNNWVDENAFFTVGKSWAHGIIPYKDIFEQKGPLLYLIFMLGYFISNHSFLGIFIFEILGFTISLYYCSKIVNLYLDQKYIYYILPIFSAIICSSEFFVHGGSAEEFCFSFFAISLYYFLRHFSQKEITYKELLLNGMLAGCISMIKFNLLGFWFVFMMCIFISLLLKKQIKKAFVSCVYFVIGMLIPIGLFSIYFLSVHGFEEFITTYILFNSNNYTAKMLFSDRIAKIFEIFYSQLSSSFVIFNLIDVGLLYFLLNKKLIKDKFGKLALFLLILFSIFGIYWNVMSFPYYFLFILFFVILGLIAIYYQAFNNKKINKKTNLILMIITVVLFGVLLANSNNITYSKNKKSDLVQYKFAKIINKKKNATMLNYGFLDGGFYFAADILPNTKYFHKVNASLPKLEEELLEKIKSKKFDFIVVRCYKTFDPRNEILYDNYTLVSEGKEVMENIEFTYYLYRKN